VQVFELRVAEALESDEFYKARSEVGVPFEFDELVGGHNFRRADDRLATLVTRLARFSTSATIQQGSPWRRPPTTYGAHCRREERLPIRPVSPVHDQLVELPALRVGRARLVGY
jgi:hypothetical protein